MKSVVTIVLLLFVAVSVAYLVVSEIRSRPVAVDSAGAQGTDAATRGDAKSEIHGEMANKRAARAVIAYYFHGTSRCPTCLKMEQYAQDAIKGAYQAEIGSGRIRWQAVNYDEPANEHFVTEYGLVASSLVIVSNKTSTSDGWRKLDRTWDLVGNEEAFKKYVTDEVRMMLGSDP